jgi:Spy/CpxP family protein refolding chaperone
MKFIRPIVITGLLLTALPAFAQSTVTAQVSKDGGNACQSRDGFKSTLKLTPAQREKLGTLHDQFILGTADKKAQLEVAHNEMRRLFQQPTIDKQAVLTLETKVNGLKDDLSTARVNLMLSSADIFTPEQRAAFAKFHAMRGRHHHFGGHGSSFRGEGQGDRKVG